MNYKVYLHIIYILLTINSFAQNSQVVYGKNRIQNKNFKWEYLSTNNFDIYFYYGGRESAIYAAKYAETDYKSVCKSLGLSNYRHVRLLIYNTPKDLLMSNIELNEPDPALGGIATLVKANAEVCFEGNHEKFRNEIKKEVARYLINEVLFGGNAKEILKNSYLMNIPEWYVSGLAYFTGYGYSQELDNHLRSMSQTGKLMHPNVLNGKDAELYGASVWNYIQIKYGASNVSNLLHITQDTKNPKDAINMVLGLSYSQFIKDWKNFYLKMSGDLEEGYNLADKALAITSKNKKGKTYTNLKISNTGDFITYTENKQGKYKVAVYDIQKAKTKYIYAGGYKVYTQTPDETMPLVALFADRIGVVDFIKDKFWLKIYDKRGRFDQKIELPQFENILSLDFSEDGNAVIFSGQMNGQSDLWYLNFKDNTYKQVTSDFQDDLNPIFVKGSSNSIIYSSNKLNDTLLFTRVYPDKIKIKDFSTNTDLYLLENIKNPTKLVKLTNTLDKEDKPLALDAQTITYLASYNGITQLYSLDLKTKVSKPVTKFLTDIKAYHLVPKTTFAAFICKDKNKERIYFDPEFSANLQNYPFANTFRKERIDLKVQEALAMQEYEKYVRDSLANNIDINNLSFANEDTIDINNYTFESDLDTAQTKAKLPEDYITMKGPVAYKHVLGITSITNSMYLDNLNGFGVSQGATLTDILGNHKLTGNFTYFLDFRSSYATLEYQYLKRRVDFGFKISKNRSWEANQDDQVFHKYGLNIFEGKFSYPFTPATRISITPTVFNQLFLNFNPNYPNTDINRFYGGSQFELNIDNSELTGTNMRKGVRFRMLYEHFQGLSAKAKNFGRFDMDMRLYQPIVKHLIFAIRGAGGTFVGPGAKRFMLGGMDGSLSSNKYNYAGENNPLYQGLKDAESGNPDLMLNKFVTNVRGYQQNTVYGKNYFLINAELRIPIAKVFFPRAAVNSIFVRNLQTYYFSDMGAAWTGNDPFSRNNSFSKTDYSNGYFSGYSITYATPVLISHGFGFRSFFLGYYVKLDIAYPVRDFERKPTKFCLSLGHDF